VPSEALAPVLGEGPLPRREVLPRLWRYIRAHGLQVEVDRRVVETDAVLRRAFGGRAQVSMFELLGLVSRHLTPWEGEGPG
jgi:DNA topoisomerase-3